MSAAVDNGAYRSPSPCPVCEEREAEAKRISPFVKLADVECPECNSSDYRWWGLCRGGDRVFVRSEGKKFLWWWVEKPSKFSCRLKNPPKHFHFECRRCNESWTMLSASETKKSE